jgi:hypothetical protein
MVVESREANVEVWALAVEVTAHQEKEVLEVAENAARQAVAFLQAQSIDVATIRSTTGPFLGPYRVTTDLVSSAYNTAMVEAYVVGMSMPQGQAEEQAEEASDDIEALFGNFDIDVVMLVMTDE